MQPSSSLEEAFGAFEKRSKEEKAMRSHLEYGNTSGDLVRESLQVHNLVMGQFHEMTTKHNRSLASKYLHFHCPQAFYLYDNRAASTITK